MQPVEVGQHLVIDPRVCHGQLTFKGMRVSGETVLVYLAKGRSLEQILADWPQLQREAVVEAVHLAATALVERAADDWLAEAELPVNLEDVSQALEKVPGTLSSMVHEEREERRAGVDWDG
jgi:uncharacterized protein (DUF433 family)